MSEPKEKWLPRYSPQMMTKLHAEEAKNCETWELLFNAERTGFILYDVTGKTNAEQRRMGSSVVGITYNFEERMFDTFNRNIEEFIARDMMGPNSNVAAKPGAPVPEF